MLQKVAIYWIVCLLIIAALLLLMHLLARASGLRLRPVRLLLLHRDQRGSVQSLSFVLTLPLFILIMMGIVQVSQIMLAKVVVEYAAIAAARAASVWVPERISTDDGSFEHRNCIGTGRSDGKPIEGGTRYTLYEGQPGEAQTSKISQIISAACIACVPIAPSRDTGYQLAAAGVEQHTALVNAYQALTAGGGSVSNEGIAQKLTHKLAYAGANTQIKIESFHPTGDPHLQQYTTYYQYNPTYTVDSAQGVGRSITPGICPPQCRGGLIYFDPDYVEDSESFKSNEIGWQDVITVTVKHELALLPGPGRLLSRWVNGSNEGRDEIAENINQIRGTYTWPLVAKASATNEGEMSILRYGYYFISRGLLSE